MAILENKITGEKLILRSHHVFGRRKVGTDTLLENRFISQIHASIRWEKEQWKILDHSRNGTWVDGKQLKDGKGHELKKGQEIRFGGPKEAAWLVLDTNAPTTVLAPLQGGGSVIELKRFHVLPSEEEPVLSVYLSKNQQWVCESEEGISSLSEGDLVRVGDQLWRFFNAQSILETPSIQEAPVKSESYGFRFQVSSNEEHVHLKFHQGEEIYDLKERSHHYMLLILARQRLQDYQESGDPLNHGWIDIEELGRMLDMDRVHLNMQIFRARKQLDKTLPDNQELPQVLERRVGEIRLGCPFFQIFRGSTLEGKITSI